MSEVFTPNKEKYGLFEKRPYYKPFEYPWAYDLYKLQSRAHWLPEESPVADDIADYRQKLTDDERNIIAAIFRFFTQADSDVASGYSEHYLPLLCPPEIRMMLLTFGSFEAIHQDAYSQLIDTLGFPEDSYKVFMEYKAMVDKHEFLEKQSTGTIEDLAKTIAVFSAFTEGVQLFGSFAILMNFPRHNLMKNMGQIISWSIRDENLHVKGMSQVFRALIDEYPELWTDALKCSIYTAAEQIVALEFSFIDTVFEQVTELRDMTKEELKQYIKHLAGQRLMAIGLKDIYGEENPFPWIDYLVSGVEHANFFETRATEYAKASTSGTWADVFSR